MAAAFTPTARWKDRRQRVRLSVFPADMLRPCHATSFPAQDVSEDQICYDRAWHTVTSRIALPSSAAAEDSFGTLPPDSQLQSQGFQTGSEAEFQDALRLVVDAQAALPRASRRGEHIVTWHMQQVRRHFAHHVLPLLAACADGQPDNGAASPGDRGEPEDQYERQTVVVMTSVRTLEAAVRLYTYGLQLVARGIHRLRSAREIPGLADPQIIVARFRRDVHALVTNSASPRLMSSLRFVLTRLVAGILGIPPRCGGPAALVESSALPGPTHPRESDPDSLAARKRLFDLIEPLDDVGLTGEKFQILFAEIMDSMMAEFVRGAFAGVWGASGHDPGRRRRTPAPLAAGPQRASPAAASPCIASLFDWVENDYARLATEVLSRTTAHPHPVDRQPVTFSDVRTYQSLALGRLAALRISELYDIVLAWPSSRGALDDLRVAIATPHRRLQLTDSFAATVERRLLHPGRSTLEILQTYIAIIRTFHALDHSKVLLARVVPNLQLYLCGREDAVRTVVTGLLASPEEIAAANDKAAPPPSAVRDGAGLPTTPACHGLAPSPGQASTRPEEGPGPATREAPEGVQAMGGSSNNKLVELALLLSDPAQSRSAMGPEDDTELEWDDMSWVPDPVDAGTNYKRPRGEDVIGTVISSLGSEDAFIREFQVIVAERLLSSQGRFDQEIRVLNLLKKRFGDAALQNCDVMIRDIHESRKLDAAIRRARGGGPREPAVTPKSARAKGQGTEDLAPAGAPYRARILSRLFWPTLEREHFILPAPVAEQQKDYEQGYEQLKSSRRLTWLNQLGQATVELELQDRTVSTECKTYEAVVIHAFQPSGEEQPGTDGALPARRTVDGLADRLQMDDDLVRSALDFWVSQDVLRRVQGDAYVVAETLSPAGPPLSQGGAPSTPGSPLMDSPRRGAGSKGNEQEQARRLMYWQYVRGMLTNASATMPLAQVGMMLRMLVADGLPWGDEELQEYLGEKVAEGELELVGGKYRLAKK